MTIVGSGDTFRDKIYKKSCPRDKDRKGLDQSLIKEQVAVSSKKEYKSKEEERKQIIVVICFSYLDLNLLWKHLNV